MLDESKASTRYDPETHTYWLNGTRIASVTEILQSVGLIDATWFTEESAWRGSVIHRTCQLDDEDDLDESSVPEEAKEYLEGWRRFKRESGINGFREIEKPIITSEYAGTPDRVASDLTVIEIKSGTVQPWASLQLAAYALLICPGGLIRRLAVRIGSDGKYSMKEFPLRERRTDLQIFLGALTLYNWRRSNT